MMCSVCGDTGYRKTAIRHGVATGTSRSDVIWADHAVLEPCHCQQWRWPNTLEPRYILIDGKKELR